MRIRCFAAIAAASVLTACALAPVASAETTSLDNGGVPVISPLGIPANALPPGVSASGKIYFDVTDAAPTAIAYTVNGADAVVWD